MNNRGVIGKIFLAIFLVILIIAGVTAYQVYDLVTSITTQKGEIQTEIESLSKGDCSKISSIETRTIILESKATSACKNPIINLASKKVKELPYTCSDLSELKNVVDKGLADAKKACDLKTLNNFTQEAITEFVENMSSEYIDYAKKYNVSEMINVSI